MRLSFRVLLPAAQASFTIALALTNFGVVKAVTPLANLVEKKTDDAFARYEGRCR